MTLMRPRKRRDDEKTTSWKLVAVPASVGRIRAYAEEALRKWGLDRVIGDATLVVPELATNASSRTAARGKEITVRLPYLSAALDREATSNCCRPQ